VGTPRCVVACGHVRWGGGKSTDLKRSPKLWQGGVLVKRQAGTKKRGLEWGGGETLQLLIITKEKSSHPADQVRKGKLRRCLCGFFFGGFTAPPCCPGSKGNRKSLWARRVKQRDCRITHKPRWLLKIENQKVKWGGVERRLGVGLRNPRGSNEMGQGQKGGGDPPFVGQREQGKKNRLETKVVGFGNGGFPGGGGGAVTNKSSRGPPAKKPRKNDRKKDWKKVPRQKSSPSGGTKGAPKIVPLPPGKKKKKTFSKGGKKKKPKQDNDVKEKKGGDGKKGCTDNGRGKIPQEGPFEKTGDKKKILSKGKVKQAKHPLLGKMEKAGACR